MKKFKFSNICCVFDTHTAYKILPGTHTLAYQVGAIHRQYPSRHFDLAPGCAMASDIRADYKFAPNQWETTLHCNDVSHRLGANLESALDMY